MNRPHHIYGLIRPFLSHAGFAGFFSLRMSTPRRPDPHGRRTAASGANLQLYRKNTWREKNTGRQKSGGKEKENGSRITPQPPNTRRSSPIKEYRCIKGLPTPYVTARNGFSSRRVCGLNVPFSRRAPVSVPFRLRGRKSVSGSRTFPKPESPFSAPGVTGKDVSAAQTFPPSCDAGRAYLFHSDAADASCTLLWTFPRFMSTTADTVLPAEAVSRRRAVLMHGICSVPRTARRMRLRHTGTSPSPCGEKTGAVLRIFIRKEPEIPKTDGILEEGG